MAGDFGLVYSPWNHTRRADELLDRALGEVGLDHLTVPVVTGETIQFRMSGDHPSPYFHTEGGWHYPAQGHLYAASGVRPRTARWCGARDVLGELRERAKTHGLALMLRVDLPAVRSVVDHAPNVRCRNAWGDELVSFTPCVCSSEFRELLRATLADLTRYEPTGFELRGLHLAPVPLTRVPSVPDPCPLVDQVALCFCAACRQIATLAGVDADAAAEMVRLRVNEWSATPSIRWESQDLDGAGVLAAYVAARHADWRKWLDRLAAAQSGRRMYFIEEAGLLQRQMLPVLDPSARAAMPARLVSAGGSSPWLRLLALSLGVAQTPSHQQTWEAYNRCGPFHGATVALWNPAQTGFTADDLVRDVAGWVSAGTSFIEFEDLEQAPPEVVTWVRQAVRYARRG